MITPNFDHMSLSLRMATTARPHVNAVCHGGMWFTQASLAFPQVPCGAAMALTEVEAHLRKCKLCQLRLAAEVMKKFHP